MTAWRYFDEVGSWLRLDDGRVLLTLPAYADGDDDPALRELAGEAGEVDFSMIDADAATTLSRLRELLEACDLLERWLVLAATLPMGTLPFGSWRPSALAGETIIYLEP